MAYFDCIVGGSGKGNTLVVTCADDLAGATITCTNGTKTYTKTCPSTSPYEVTFYGLEAGTWTVSTTVSGDTYTTTVVITDYEAELGGFSWRAWVDLSENYTSSDFTDLDDLLSDETAIRELMTIHACVDYLAGIAATSADVEKIIENDYCAKWINNRDYALDTLYANEIIAGYMDTADKYFYGEWVITDNTTTPPTWGAKGNVPVMTSNTAPYGVASASSEYSSYPASMAFDKTDSTWVTNNSASSFSNIWIGYKFTNPTCVKRFKIVIGTKITAMSVKLQASNDGFVSDINDLTDVINGTSSSWATPTTYEVNNDDYYMSYRLFIVSQTLDSSAYGGRIMLLQFYGRELSVSVPKMTGNTTPYGVVSATTQYSGDYAPWKAFSSEKVTLSDKGWLPSASDSFDTAKVIYDFRHKIKVKMIKISARSSDTYTFKFAGSNDGTNFTVFKTAQFSLNEAIKCEEADSENEYRYIAAIYSTNISQSLTSGIGFKFNFYGLDYSEKEFEEGTTKKWLYDHGVEVVAIDAMRDAGSKQPDCLNVAVGSSSANNTWGLTTPTDAIDLTPYSLIRAKVGKNMVGTIQPQVSTQKTSYDSGRISYITIDQSHNKAMIPNDLTLDISAVNQNAYPNITVGTTNMNTDIAEWWLE